MNKNRLDRAKKLALINLKLEYAKGLINFYKELNDQDSNNWLAICKAEQLLRYYNGQQDRIRRVLPDNTDILDVTQIGSSYPIGINTNGY